jgi:hypothetical protein
MNTLARRLMLAALLVAVSGCGGGRYPVEGVVQFDDGTPAASLAGGTVSLESVADRSNASGQIRDGGAFRIRDPLGRDGVPAGAYRVIVLPPEDSDRHRPPIDPTYGRYDTSGIEVQVKEQKNTITVVVRRKGNPKKS